MPFARQVERAFQADDARADDGHAQPNGHGALVGQIGKVHVRFVDSRDVRHHMLGAGRDDDGVRLLFFDQLGRDGCVQDEGGAAVCRFRHKVVVEVPGVLLEG